MALAQRAKIGDGKREAVRVNDLSERGGLLAKAAENATRENAFSAVPGGWSAGKLAAKCAGNAEQTGAKQSNAAGFGGGSREPYVGEDDGVVVVEEVGGRCGEVPSGRELAWIRIRNVTGEQRGRTQGENGCNCKQRDAHGNSK